MALPSYYNTGAASVAAAGTTVTGTDTFWLGRVWPGDLFGSHLGFGVRIASVDSDEQLTLSYPWPGQPQADAAYEIQLVPDGVRAQETTRLLLEKMQQGMFINPDATGTLAQRAQYDDEPSGFRYLRTDVNPFLLYIKNSDAPGNWSAGAAFVGPKGDDGLPGQSGVGDAYDILVDALGRPGDGEEFLYPFARSVQFPADFSGSVARVTSAPTDETVFDLLRIIDATGTTTQVGTITFAPGETEGVISAASAGFIARDTLIVRSPSPRDATLGGISFVLAGSRI